MELFTIALMVYQQRHRLERCLEHIFQQDYKAVELIVCDDDSCDFDVDEVEAYIYEHKSDQIQFVTVHKQPAYMGQAAGCQTALSMAHGTYMMFLTVEQELYGKDALTKMAQYFRMAHGSVLVSRSLPFWEDGGQAGGICPSDADIKMLEETASGRLFVQFGTHSFEPSICTAPVCFRKERLEQIGFDTDYPCIPFWTLWLKLCEAKEEVIVFNEITVHTCIYKVEDDLAYIAFGMKDRYYSDCIKMLQDYAGPRMEQYSFMDRVRCRHAAAVLTMVMNERKWNTWKFHKKLLWKIKNMPVLLMGRFYQMRAGKFYISTQKELRWLMILSLLFYLNIPLAPDGSLGFLWAAGAAAAFVVLAVKIISKLCINIMKAVMDYRADRRKI